MALTPLADRYFIFNFFEPPISDDKEVEQKWTAAAEYLRDNEKDFVSTYLHKTGDPNARFRWINFAALSSDDVCVFPKGKPNPHWVEITKDAMQNTVRARPAGYREVASYNGNPLVADKKQSPESSAFIVTAVKVNESISDEEFEKNWKEWSGADLLHSKMDQGAITDTFLYRMFTTKMCPEFRYVVRSEIKNTDDASGYEVAKLLNSRNCATGIETSSGFYRVAITY